MNSTRQYLQRRLQILLAQVADLEEEIYGNKYTYRYRNLEKNNRRWEWIRYHTKVLMTPEGEAICSFVVSVKLNSSLTDEEATVLAVDRALTEGWQPSEGSTIEYHCPNLLIEADGTPACKLCFPKAITEMSVRRQ